MRVRILAKPAVDCIDGIQLTRFQPGFEYEIGPQIAELMIVEGWAEPVVTSTGDELSSADQPRSDTRAERRSNILRLTSAN